MSKSKTKFISVKTVTIPYVEFVKAYSTEHKIVKHVMKEFVSGMASTNQIGSVWSILKRRWVGIYHHFSQKHLQLYVNEFCFRLNGGKCSRKLEDRILSLSGLGIKTKHMTYGDLLSRKRR